MKKDLPRAGKVPQRGLEQLPLPPVYANRLNGLARAGEGVRGPAVFRVLSSPRKPPPEPPEGWAEAGRSAVLACPRVSV